MFTNLTINHTSHSTTIYNQVSQMQISFSQSITIIIPNSIQNFHQNPKKFCFTSIILPIGWKRFSDFFDFEIYPSFHSIYFMEFIYSIFSIIWEHPNSTLYQNHLKFVLFHQCYWFRSFGIKIRKSIFSDLTFCPIWFERFLSYLISSNYLYQNNWYML